MNSAWPSAFQSGCLMLKSPGRPRPCAPTGVLTAPVACATWQPQLQTCAPSRCAVLSQRAACRSSPAKPHAAATTARHRPPRRSCHACARVPLARWQWSNTRLALTLTVDHDWPLDRLSARTAPPFECLSFLSPTLPRNLIVHTAGMPCADTSRLRREPDPGAHPAAHAIQRGYARPYVRSSCCRNRQCSLGCRAWRHCSALDPQDSEMPSQTAHLQGQDSGQGATGSTHRRTPCAKRCSETLHSLRGRSSHTPLVAKTAQMDPKDCRRPRIALAQRVCIRPRNGGVWADSGSDRTPELAVDNQRDLVHGGLLKCWNHFVWALCGGLQTIPL